MSVDFNTVLKFVQVGLALVPEGEALYKEVKMLFGTDEQGVLDRALIDSRKRADDQHDAAQKL